MNGASFGISNHSIRNHYLSFIWLVVQMQKENILRVLLIMIIVHENKKDMIDKDVMHSILWLLS